MTPLAHRIVKELTLPLKARTFNDQCGLLRRMGDVHCFEVSEVFGMAQQLAADMMDRGEWLERTSFLPAPRTWIEYRDATAGRVGILLESTVDSVHADVRLAGPNGSEAVPRSLWLGANSETNPQHTGLVDGSAFPRILIALLAIINTPRLIGRKQHMPHRGLERAMVNAQPVVGKFPLHAWTELTLSVSALMKQADGTVHEAHLTGEKCLHFCRAHIRVRNGQLEQVKAHWRGNPALGIKRTRYRLAA